MTTVSHEPTRVVEDKRRWTEFVVREMWASLSMFPRPWVHLAKGFCFIDEARQHPPRAARDASPRNSSRRVVSGLSDLFVHAKQVVQARSRQSGVPDPWVGTP